MKKLFLLAGTIGLFSFLMACGGEEPKEPEIKKNPLNNMMNNMVNEVENEIQHQISDPNSELLEAVDTMKELLDTVKDIFQDKVIEEVKQGVNKEIEKHK
ncbi:MAG: hypothetical protein R2780_03415 [Crocinitomicaceae bacterium]|nr:hypothetical protein [Crocinitomicaceae bacterium]